MNFTTTEIGRRCRVLTTALLASVAALAATAGTRADDRIPDALAKQAQADQISIQQLAFTARPDDEWFATVRLGGQAVTLQLAPHSLRSLDSRLLCQTADGMIERPLPPAATYRGRVLGRPGSLVALSFIAGQANAMIDLGGGETWWLQPMSDFDSAADRGAYAVYPRSAINPLEGACGGEIDSGLVDAAGPGTTGNCIRLAQIAFDADFEFFTQYGSVTTDAVAGIESVLNGVAAIYNRDVNVDFTITTTIVRETDVIYTGGTSATLLGSVDNEWSANNGAITRDTVHLLTGKATGGTLGVAFLNALCSNNVAYGWSQSRTTTAMASRVGVTAHEIGHNFNASHCDGDPDCSIMCSGLGGCAGNITKFSFRSVNSIRAKAASSGCLQSVAAVTDPLVPGADNDFFTISNNAVAATFDVMSNDGDGNCQTISIQTFAATSNDGAVITRSVGSGPNGRDRLVYTPPFPDSSGLDSFTYTLADSGGSTATATVYIDDTFQLPAQPITSLSANGLDAAYYVVPTTISVLPNFASLTPYLHANVPNLAYSSTNGAFANSGRTNQVAAVFTGYFIAPVAGKYTFYTQSDDGSNMYFGNNRTVSNDGVHGMTERSGYVYLAAGNHPFRVEFFENSGGAGLVVSVVGPSGSGLETKAAIATTSLLRRIPCPADVATVGGSAGADFLVTPDDLVAFLAAFFANNRAMADIVGPGGSGGPDGQITVDDLVAYLSRFFAPCP